MTDLPKMVNCCSHNQCAIGLHGSVCPIPCNSICHPILRRWRTKEKVLLLWGKEQKYWKLFFFKVISLDLKVCLKPKQRDFRKLLQISSCCQKNKFTSYTLKVSTPQKSENTNICWHTKNAESVARPCVCTKLLQQKILEPFEIWFFRDRWNKMLNWSLVHTGLSMQSQTWGIGC